MNVYELRTTATMKPHNNKKWWIADDIIKDIELQTETIEDALKDYQEIAKNNYYITISNNALKNKKPMYIDTTQGVKKVGYVLTAKADFEKGDSSGFSSQYIDLWVQIVKVDKYIF